MFLVHATQVILRFHLEGRTVYRESLDRKLAKSFAESNHQGISLYIHLPYCESLCTFCGCNKRITKNHSVEEPYIDALLKEWDMYTSFIIRNSTNRRNTLWRWYAKFFQTSKSRSFGEGHFSKSYISR
jgi:oxygen-independent coproporphyrinogen-3 oxidase